MKNTFKFYSPEEIEEIKSAIAEKQKFTKFSRQFSERTGRPYEGVYIKVRSISKKLANGEEISTVRKKRTVNSSRIKAITPPKKVITKPNVANVSPEAGMVITLYPKSVTIQNNICQLHF